MRLGRVFAEKWHETKLNIMIAVRRNPKTAIKLIANTQTIFVTDVLLKY